MVRGAIPYDTRPSLILTIHGTMIAQRYVSDILHPTCVSTNRKAPRSYIFQQDNASPQTTRVSQDCVHQTSIFPWPARSLYLSPIEHIWDRFRRQVFQPRSLTKS
ncbi:transposable element Tcb1 transposase [Trichonephila clavipes]|nr:transposable element Tcb1 transposase [Trichonephila clavipes]